MISWLHISDLHFNGADDMSTALLRDELPKFLKGKHIDYIFCTGDIREGASRVFPDEAADYLKELCLAAHVDSTRLFIVPGNHDIDRTSPGRDEAIERVIRTRGTTRRKLLDQACSEQVEQAEQVYCVHRRSRPSWLLIKPFQLNAGDEKQGRTHCAHQGHDKGPRASDSNWPLRTQKSSREG